MKKRLISFLACGVLAASASMGLAACGGSDKIVVWGPSEQQTLLKEMIEEFKEQNPDFKLDIQVGVCSESDAYANLSKDVQAGADVFGYANDQLMNLRTIGALSYVPTTVATKFLAENKADSMNSGKIGDYYYGYPYASDNGFFLYYDNSIISAEEATSLDDILAACKKNKKYFIFDIDNSWYVGAFLYGAGGTCEVTYTEGGILDEVFADFDQKPEGSELTYGEIGGAALIALNGNDYFLNGDDNSITTYLDSGKFGACISGTWKSAELSQKLGDHYAATRCPDFTGGDGKTYPMVAFHGHKLYGVNGFTKHPNEAHQIAQFLASKEMQEKRFNEKAIGPSNLEVANSEAVKANVALQALAAQEAYGNYLVQTSLHSDYWTYMEAFGTDIYTKTTTSSNLLAAVKTLNDGIKG